MSNSIEVGDFVAYNWRNEFDIGVVVTIINMNVINVVWLIQRDFRATTILTTQIGYRTQYFLLKRNFYVEL